MCRVFRLDILESQETLQSLLKKEKDVRKRERLQFLYWCKTGQGKTRKALGELLNRSQFAIGQWADTYRAAKPICHRSMGRHLSRQRIARFASSRLSGW